MTHSNTVSGIDKSPRILVADDTDVNQKIVELILQKAGYRVDVVENGQQAAEACRQNNYDLILMDIQMPLMDGHEATKRIRSWEQTLKAEKEGKAQSSKLKEKGLAELSASSFQLSARAQRVPIIAMTGSAAAGSFDEQLYPGMNDCIGKPLQRDLLLSAVQKWIRAESKTQTNENPAGETRLTETRSGEDQFPLDMYRAIQEFMGEKEILYDVLQKFVTSAGFQIDTIRQAVNGVDYRVIASEAHAIKGAAANLTADKLAGLASDLELAAEARQSNLTGELAEKLEQEFYILARYLSHKVLNREIDENCNP